METAGLYFPQTNDIACAIASCERELMRAYLDDDETLWVKARTAKLFIELELSGHTDRSACMLSDYAPPWRCI
jgi:hypothetical protein